jgi:2-iminobutanoate/2-iminopropanoate deaminase
MGAFMKALRTLFILAAVAGCTFAVPSSARDFVKGENPQRRGYSLSVTTEGGKIVWLGGQTASVDDNGKSLADDFEGQVRQVFT